MTFPTIFSFIKRSPFLFKRAGGEKIPEKQEKQKKKWILDPTKCFTLSEVRNLMEAAIRRKKHSKAGVADWMFIIFGLATGLRISEIAALKVKHIVLESTLYPHVFVECGKTVNARRRVPINAPTIEAIFEYQKYRLSWGQGFEPEQPFLVSPIGKDKHYTRSGLYRSFIRVLSLAKGVDKQGKSPHSLRHTFATHLYKVSNHNLKLVQQLLGHSNINVTSVYTSVSEELHSVEDLYTF